MLIKRCVKGKRPTTSYQRPTPFQNTNGTTSKSILSWSILKHNVLSLQEKHSAHQVLNLSLLLSQYLSCNLLWNSWLHCAQCERMHRFFSSFLGFCLSICFSPSCFISSLPPGSFRGFPDCNCHVEGGAPAEKISLHQQDFVQKMTTWQLSTRYLQSFHGIHVNVVAVKSILWRCKTM